MSGISSAGITPQLARIINVTVTDDTLSVDLEDGRTISVPIGWYPRLANGTPAERAIFKSAERVTHCIGPNSTKILASKG